MRTTTRKLAVAALLAIVVMTGMPPSEETRAAQLQANITSICAQIPALKDAMEYTVKTWPNTAAVREKVGVELITRVFYFDYMILGDNEYCNVTAKNTIYTSNVQSESILGTMTWHYGMASVALREYQIGVGAITQ
jgi:hypothetical protein